MKFVYFTHSLRSCWNHGNAHFVRGVVRALMALGHAVDVWEPKNGWSLTRLETECGQAALRDFARTFPDLHSRFYGAGDVERIVQGADVVIVHEWTEPEILAELGRIRRRGATYQLLFHDTHHRAVSEPESMARFALDNCDAVLAFGESLSELYRSWGHVAYTWHEAADTSHFYPRTPAEEPEGVVWIGNWGDDERTAELDAFLFEPVQQLGLKLTVRGVRYPAAALARLRAVGAEYGGWIANADAPWLFASHRMTVHVPRRFYVRHLPGIPTIRVFEALACGIPLVSAWWPDEERLFREGDFLVGRSTSEIEAHMRALDNDAELRGAMARGGLETIRERHSCAHRARELVEIVGHLHGDAERKRGAA